MAFASSPYQLELFFSSDNGSSFVNLETPSGGMSAITIGAHNETANANVLVKAVDSGNGRLMLTQAHYSDVGQQEKCAGELNLSGLTNTNWTNIYSTHLHPYDNGAFYMNQNFAVIKKTTAWNCLKFETGGGNFVSGVITLYGIKTS